MATENSFSDEALWAEGLAARLRLLQANFSEELPASRQKYLFEEVEQALHDVGPSRKKLYLETLATRFPSWESPAGTLPSPAAAPAPGAAADTPDQLAAKLIAATSTLSESARLRIARELSVAGLALPASAAPAPALEIPQELAAKLFLSPGQALDFERACKLLAALLEWVTLLEQAAWKLWKEVNPSGRLKREGVVNGDLKAMIGNYVAGDPEVSTQQLVQVLQQSRRLIAGLLVALGTASRTYASDYYYRYLPTAVEDVARTEKKAFESLEAACWRKYCELTAGVSPATIEKELRDVIARSAEEVMVGPKGGG